MAARTRTKHQRELDSHTIVEMMRRGKKRYEIAEQLGVHPSQVTCDWRKILAELVADRDESALEIKARLLAELAEVKTQAWLEWERSKEDVVRKTIQRSLFPGDPEDDADTEIADNNKSTAADADGDNGDNGGEGEDKPKKPKIVVIDAPKLVVMREGRLGNAAFLNVIKSCIDQEAELEGLLDRRNQTNLNIGVGVNVSLDWDAVLKAAGETAGDVVESKIVEGVPLLEHRPNGDGGGGNPNHDHTSKDNNGAT